jgi:hypothetical protein
MQSRKITKKRKTDKKRQITKTLTSMLGWLVASRTLVSETVLAMMFRQIRSTCKIFIGSAQDPDYYAVDPECYWPAGVRDQIRIIMQSIRHVIGGRCT